jgi:hypothetical protein
LRQHRPNCGPGTGGGTTAAPRNEPRESWSDGPVIPNDSFPEVAGARFAYELSWEIPYARPLPQIFLPEFVYEWYNVKRYAQEQGENMFISGVTTSCTTTACDFTDTSDWTTKLGTNAFLTPDQGWYALYETMNAQFTPEVDQTTGESLRRPNPVEQRLLPYLTDFANGAAPR